MLHTVQLGHIIIVDLMRTNQIEHAVKPKLSLVTLQSSLLRGPSDFIEQQKELTRKKLQCSHINLQILGLQGTRLIAAL